MLVLDSGAAIGWRVTRLFGLFLNLGQLVRLPQLVLVNIHNLFSTVDLLLLRNLDFLYTFLLVILALLSVGHRRVRRLISFGRLQL